MINNVKFYLAIVCIFIMYTQAHANSAKEIQEWFHISRIDTLSAYEYYLEKYPQSKYRKTAELRVREFKNEIELHISQSDKGFMPKGMWQDPKTGLVWMRCSLGQTWNGRTCNGSATRYGWDEAVAEVKVFNQQGFSGYTDWRLPHIEELTSLIYCPNGFTGQITIPMKSSGYKTIKHNCQSADNRRPTNHIYNKIFPNNYYSAYWSATPYERNTLYIWFLDLGHGKVDYYFGGNQVRLVRGSLSK